MRASEQQNWRLSMKNKGEGGTGAKYARMSEVANYLYFAFAGADPA